MEAKMQLQDGKIKWKDSKCPLLTKNCWESMKKQLNSSGIFSQDFRHCRFFKRSSIMCENGTLNLRNSQTGSSSCQCSTTSIGQRKGLRIQKKSRITRRYSCKDTGRFWVLERKKVVWISSLPEGKWESIANQMVERFKDAERTEKNVREEVRVRVCVTCNCTCLCKCICIFICTCVCECLRVYL